MNKKMTTIDRKFRDIQQQFPLGKTAIIYNIPITDKVDKITGLIMAILNKNKANIKFVRVILGKSDEVMK